MDTIDELAVYRLARREMVTRQIMSRGIKNPALLSAMQEIPRHLFLRANLWSEAYQDRPLPIACGQTISQPYMVAAMTEALELEAGMKVLEVGTGSGYQTAILLAMGCKVFGLERYSELVDQSRVNLQSIGLDGADLRLGNAYEGWPDNEKFDRIIVAAATENLPNPLKKQLSPKGLCVVPEGKHIQHLVLYKNREQFERKVLMPVRFVPLVNQKPNLEINL